MRTLCKEKGLLDTPGWKRFKKIAKRQKKLVPMVRQARLKSIRRAPIYQFGFRVPRNIKEAWELVDKENGTTRWKDAMILELWQLAEYDTFHDTGKGTLYQRTTNRSVYTTYTPSSTMDAINHA